MPNEEQLLPIKLVFETDTDYRTPETSGSGPKVFEEVTDQLRLNFSTEVDVVHQHFQGSFDRWRGAPAVARVHLKKEAIAKSHRPTEVFNPDTCPIIGANRLGELYVSVSPRGLDRLKKVIETGGTQRQVANISTLTRIEPYQATTANEAIRRAVAQGQPLRCRLFRHRSPQLNLALDEAFDSLLQEYHLDDTAPIHYAAGLSVYSIHDTTPAAVEALGKFVGTQSLTPFPEYRVVRTASRVVGDVTALTFPAPETGREYPVVGIIDSGTDPTNPFLQPWIVDRREWVPRELQDNSHGSFVAALIAQGKRLNHNDPRFPDASARIVDVVAIGVDPLPERDLLLILDDAIARFPYVKIWNLSLGGDDPCDEDEVSLLGAALDERARKHGLLFVISAGNYLTPRTWPPQSGIDGADRICPPADAVRALTVGSVAHLDTPSTVVRREEPSPFSRRGPGPAGSQKPEISNYGGNCDSTGSYVQAGIISVDGTGHLSENIGTSFSAPPMSSMAAAVEQELASSGPVSPTLIKGLMVHSAFLRSGPPDPLLVNYVGAGFPGEISSILNCRQSAATVILQVPVQPGKIFEKDPFPMPRSLIEPGVGLRAEIFMTLIYDPPLERNYGVEYCRTNVSASLGTVGLSEKSQKVEYRREVLPVPALNTGLHEEELVKFGLKWCPLKHYYRRFSRGPTDRPWRLTLSLLAREGFVCEHPQDVFLIITIRALTEGAQVYNELVQSMTRLNWPTQNLQVRSRARTRS